LAGEEVLIESLDLDPATAPVATDAVVTTNAQPTPAVSKPMEQTEHKEGHTGVVAGTAGAAGAAVVAVGAAEVLNEGGLAGSTSAPEAVTTPGPDLVSRLTDPDNLTKLILIGLGVVVVVCAIYFVARRVRARKR
jgi:NAD(P)H-hydrate repair Nnr-like enzyme with NAD(P)H-hydrate dehydratase domain